MRSIWRICLMAGLIMVAPARANLVPEPSYAMLMAGSQLVLIGTVTATDAGQYEYGSTATLEIVSLLIGEATGPVTVSTYNRVAELRPGCCRLGATYLVFLRRGADGQLMPVSGPYGMIRIGAPDLSRFPPR